MLLRVGNIGLIQATSACRIATSAKRSAAQGESGTSDQSRRSAIDRRCVFRDHALVIAAVPPGGSASRSAHGPRATMRISARVLALSEIREKGLGSSRRSQLLPSPLSHSWCAAPREIRCPVVMIAGCVISRVAITSTNLALIYIQDIATVPAFGRLIHP